MNWPRGERTEFAGSPTIVCFCLAVSEREIVAAIRAGAQTPQDVAAQCGAGTGCGSCREDIEALLARLKP